ncbi:HlyD family efflux transporter periplasmic adaptor subunit [Pseudomonas sp. BN606]|uniref:efflux RND transporter periplasmic adaptor subunit n=1 Tax=Pseudomonas sp. BN606 TaxID=2567894 RepID=UPI002453A250|nr:HlyD family efflux transporter periplasmic adaptor subunit [Pseudomonas sp. BN606]MDH4653573.1 HlyD family efflux transporter periplasmic adaptor subunit [Pseudomonas sp. BN606]
MNDRLPHPQLLLALAALRDRALAADSLNALAFSIANDPYALLRYHQALVLAQRGADLELLCVSGLARPSEDSPYLVWLRRASRWLNTQLTDAQPRWLAREAVEPPEDIAEGWAEWWPSGLWCIPLHDREGTRLGLVLFLLDAPPAESLAPLTDGLWQTWAHCWAAFAGRRRLFGWRPSKRQLLAALAVAAALMLVPVRQTALAPTEIVSRQAEVISSPIDGVIERMQVRPNQPVEAGTLLFTLDETTLKSRAEVLGKEVAVADAELMAASQRAFDNPQSKSELTLLNGRAQQRRAELAAVQAQLQRTRVRSPRAGVAVFSDPNDWLGKPVATGERILQVADPAQPAMLIQLPVADAIALEPGAEVTLFLTAYPLSPLKGQVLETSYQARANEEGVVAYRLLASIEGQPEHARLGLHGTAKLYGERVVLGYYLLRRPYAALRAWTGL